MKYGEIKTIISALLKEESWKSQDLRPELPVTTCLLFDIFDVIANCDDGVTRDTLVQELTFINIYSLAFTLFDKARIERDSCTNLECNRIHPRREHRQDPNSAAILLQNVWRM